jgi:hypothetical protein
MPTDNGDQYVASRYAFFDGFYKVNPKAMSEREENADRIDSTFLCVSKLASYVRKPLDN